MRLGRPLSGAGCEERRGGLPGSEASCGESACCAVDNHRGRAQDLHGLLRFPAGVAGSHSQRSVMRIADLFARRMSTLAVLAGAILVPAAASAQAPAIPT